MGLIETFFNQAVLIDALPLLWTGLIVTAELGAASIVVGLLVGLAIAIVRLYAPRPVALLAGVYIDLFRSIPLLVLLIIVYYALPFVGVRLSPFLSAMSAIGLVAAAYFAEIFRAGIQAIPRGQIEAAEALGLGFRHRLADVVLPQALRIVIPPLTGNCINVIKDTALASVVAMPDLLKQATQAQALAANPTPLIAAAAIYLAVLWPLVLLVGRLERRMGRRIGVQR
ncbi:MAG TPA: amino acid ABC transporter permease [Pseudomonadales bacterium]|nr:amino acid ABC transporter permease [Pseudomonadales bacterium]